ncbi:MAG: acyl carrier protein [Bdellovibrionales bacterium]|nr:acyl carrier protein [Bdellovibrionales bacterium]
MESLMGMDSWKRTVEVFNRVMGTKYLDSDEDVFKDKVPQWDSLKIIELAIQLQKEFDLKFESGLIINSSSLRDFYFAIEKDRSN